MFGPRRQASSALTASKRRPQFLKGPLGRALGALGSGYLPVPDSTSTCEVPDCAGSWFGKACTCPGQTEQSGAESGAVRPVLSFACSDSSSHRAAPCFPSASSLSHLLCVYHQLGLELGSGSQVCDVSSFWIPDRQGTHARWRKQPVGADRTAVITPPSELHVLVRVHPIRTSLPLPARFPCFWLPLPLTSCSQPADQPASPRLMNCSPTFSQTLGRPSFSRPEQVSS